MSSFNWSYTFVAGAKILSAKFNDFRSAVDAAFSAVDSDIAELGAEKADIAGATFTGAVGFTLGILGFSYSASGGKYAVSTPSWLGGLLVQWGVETSSSGSGTTAFMGQYASPGPSAIFLTMIGSPSTQQLLTACVSGSDQNQFSWVKRYVDWTNPGNVAGGGATQAFFWVSIGTSA
jgi:hypothetical protein